MSSNVKLCALTTISKTMDWFVVDSMRNLAKNGYDITLVCDMDEDFIKRNSDFATCIPVKMSRGVDFKGAFRGIKTFYKIFKENRFDVIQYSTPNASLYASIAGKLAKVPFRVYGQWGIRYVTFSGLKRLIFKTLEKMTCLFSTHVKAVSFKNREFAINQHLCKADKISVIGIGGTIGVDLNEFDITKKEDFRREIREKYNIAENEFLYGYVGRLNVDKGINELIQAFNGIEDAKLLLVGGMENEYGPSEENIKIAQENPNIFLTGNVEACEVRKYLAALDIHIHPTYREGFGKVLQEGMAMGCPIITTDVIGASEVIENGISGITVPAKDSLVLMQEMLALKNDEQRRKQYSNEGRIRVEKYFERSRMLNNILEDYNELLGIETKETAKV